MKLITSTIFSILVIGITAYMPPTNPTWPPTYNMTLSSITMQCNDSGFSSPTAVKRLPEPHNVYMLPLKKYNG